MRILIVENHADTASSLQQVARRYGSVGEIAPTVAAALTAAALYHFDVALIEIGLPDGHGSILAQMFQKKAIKCIALAPDATSADELRRDGSGFVATLVKPVSYDDLALLLDRVGPDDSTP
jgi:DNA-binding response OmpR family regulator